jgi:hypothetical protein
VQEWLLRRDSTRARLNVDVIYSAWDGAEKYVPFINGNHDGSADEEIFARFRSTALLEVAHANARLSVMLGNLALTRAR